MSAAKRLVVCGGNGFLGSRICKAAVSRGWDVTSISRSGEPQWQHVTSSPSPPSWAHRVSWERADIFRPAQYTSLLTNADYVIHTMGILLEADYKGVISGRESPLSGLQKAFSAHNSPNPLEREKKGQDPSPQPASASQLTYEMMNRDSAILLAKEAVKAKVGAFGYISAAAGAPVLPSRYITTKREAEQVIADEFPQMRSLFFRPPFMYDNSRAFTVPLAFATSAGSVFNQLTGGALSGFLGAAGVKPLKAGLVAEAVVEGLSEEEVSGTIEVPQMEELATKSWRRTML
ncbi:isoflavone reductase IRL [Podospora aff. communis PSN243]|uniref:Isoflavone reductase IRL n=1 Tax=Podospora aff. communis PSN243 TaxID=3040156 RepID=A0AAV9H606_9PEZI|nr:isoflavone reductase IRL [Podospora aff. communis PSN243]